MGRYLWDGAPSQKVKLLQSAQLAQISRCRSLLLQEDDSGLLFGRINNRKTSTAV